MANFLTVIHECKDYPTWRKGYDADAHIAQRPASPKSMFFASKPIPTCWESCSESAMSVAPRQWPHPGT